MVVDEFKTSNGVSIRILDDAFAGVPLEEMDRRIRRSQVVAWHIAEAAARRERGEGKDPSPVCALVRDDNDRIGGN